MPRRRVPYQACPTCLCLVDPRWHSPELCQRYQRVTSMLRGGYTATEISRRVGFSKNRVRRISHLFDVASWRAAEVERARRPTEGGPDYQIEKLTTEARRHGLTVETIRVTPGGQFKWVLVGGRKCQLVTGRVIRTKPAYSHRPYERLYRPRRQWADFLIYFVEDREGKEEPYFLIIPRDRVRKNTVLVGGEGVLAQYTNAWHLLVQRPARLRRLPDIKTPIDKVLREARRHGLQATRIGPKIKGKDYYSRRLLVEGRRCEVRRAYPKHGSCVHLNPPKSEWAEFVVYVLMGDKRKHLPMLIVPVGVILKQTFRSWNKEPLIKFADAWHQLEPS